MNKITPFLWFDDQAEEAMNFYLSIFPDGKVIDVSRYPAGAPGQAGKVMVATFQIAGMTITALNGGPMFKLSEAFSFQIHCKDQAEADHYWNTLTADGGEESQCGWCKDRFGLSWQVTPDRLSQLLSQPDKAAAGRAMQAMLKMRRIDIAELERASAG